MDTNDNKNYQPTNKDLVTLADDVQGLLNSVANLALSISLNQTIIEKVGQYIHNVKQGAGLSTAENELKSVLSNLERDTNLTQDEMEDIYNQTQENLWRKQAKGEE